jgi:hypothetical protein
VLLVVVVVRRGRVVVVAGRVVVVAGRVVDVTDVGGTIVELVVVPFVGVVGGGGRTRM